MNPLLLLHVEPNVVDAVVPEEAVHPLRLFHGIFGEHRDAVERNLVPVQGFNPFHCQRVGSTAIAEATVSVVNLLRAIHADARHDPIPPEAIAPGVVDQCGVGLDVLGEIQPLGALVEEALVENPGGFVVPVGGERERLSGMPNE